MRFQSLTVSAAALAAAAGLLAACGNGEAGPAIRQSADEDPRHTAALAVRGGTQSNQETGTPPEGEPREADMPDVVPDGTMATPDTSAEPPEAVSVKIGDDPLPFETWHHMLMPGETMQVSANGDIRIEVDGRRVGSDDTTHEWRAPRTPGVHDMRIEGADGVEHRITVFVLQPLNGETVLDGYRIGDYPQNAPEGLIRLMQDDMDAPVSPSFTIGQFICKQQPGHWPKFLLVSGNLLLRLEAVLTELREDDLTEADTFFVMSGYRTPFYNTEIRSARLSRHMYGDAADIYPDVVGNDSVMDDLNGDGRITRADAEFLYDYAEDLFAAKNLPEGGIGAYDANAVHGPFVHIDGRGHRARWGRQGS